MHGDEVELAFYPEREEGEIGFYREEQIPFVKELRAAGITAEYVHDPEHREWIGLRGDVIVSLAVAFATSFAGSAAWAGFAAVMRSSFGKARLHVRYCRRPTARGQEHWLEADGEADDVLEAMRIALTETERNGDPS